jgi:hypothetical protein
MIVANPVARAALHNDATSLAILMLPLTLRRSVERKGRLAERLETTKKINDVQRAPPMIPNGLTPRAHQPSVYGKIAGRSLTTVKGRSARHRNPRLFGPAG